MADEKGDEVHEALSKAANSLAFIKARLPVLQALSQEFGRMTRGGRDVPAMNDAVMRMVVDSFDMLVIDLCSLREWMLKDRDKVNGRGLFAILKANIHRLRRPTIDDVKLNADLFAGGIDPEAEWASMRQHHLGRLREEFDRVFPDCKRRVRAGRLERFRLRFLEETKPTDDDRNKVRAHRFAEHEAPAAVNAAFLSLDRVAEQVGVFERYIRDLTQVVEHHPGDMTHHLLADEAGTARDLADLVVFGDINSATVAYGMVPDAGIHAAGASPVWFREHRERFFGDGNLPPTRSDRGMGPPPPPVQP